MRVFSIMVISTGTICVVGAIGVLCRFIEARPRAESRALLTFRDAPIRFDASVPSIGLEVGANADLIEKLDPSKRGNASRLSATHCLHLLMAFGIDGKFADEQFSSGAELLRILTDSRQATEYWGKPAMLITRYGVRPTLGPEFKPASEAHRDQILCCFAQLGVQLNFPLVVEGEPHEFAEILSDSIANFHLGQDELEFTAIAYTLFLPPNKSWLNKFDENFSFDDLVTELLRRDLSKANCNGTHLVEALALIDRADGEYGPILSDSCRSQLRLRLDRIVAVILSTQANDGSWGPQWSFELVEPRAQRRAINDADLGNRLLATSHITQLLAHLPPSKYHLEPSVFRRAAAWLLLNSRSLDQAFIEDNFCPCCHTAWCIKHICQAGSREEVPGVVAGER